MLSMRAY